MKVFVLTNDWDWDERNSTLIGVYSSLKKAKTAMESEFNSDLQIFDITDLDFKITKENRSCEATEINNYRFISYQIYEEEVQ